MRFSFLPSTICVLAMVLLFPGGLSAQVVRLPAVDPEDERFLPESRPVPGQLVSLHPNSSSEIMQAPGEGDVAPAVPPESQPQLPPGVRNGFFQKALFDATWLAPGGSDGLGMNDLQSKVICALPCPTINSPLVITGGFGANYLQGPQATALPPHLYDAYIDLRWMTKLTPKLGVDVGLTPGVWSDFEQASNKAFRMPGHGAAAWTWNDTTKVVLGAAYLDRFDIEVIPVAGIMWTPNDDWKFDLVFPTPKISRRFYWANERSDAQQDWAYIAGEFAGDSWAIQGPAGGTNQVVLSDYRLILGLERKVIGGLSSRFEVGYVFGRRIRYSHDLPDFYPSDTVMLRGGLTY